MLVPRARLRRRVVVVGEGHGARRGEPPAAGLPAPQRAHASEAEGHGRRVGNGIRGDRGNCFWEGGCPEGRSGRQIVCRPGCASAFAKKIVLSLLALADKEPGSSRTGRSHHVIKARITRALAVSSRHFDVTCLTGVPANTISAAHARRKIAVGENPVLNTERARACKDKNDHHGSPTFACYGVWFAYRCSRFPLHAPSWTSKVRIFHIKKRSLFFMPLCKPPPFRRSTALQMPGHMEQTGGCPSSWR